MQHWATVASVVWALLSRGPRLLFSSSCFPGPWVIALALLLVEVLSRRACRAMRQHQQCGSMHEGERTTGYLIPVKFSLRLAVVRVQAGRSALASTSCLHPVICKCKSQCPAMYRYSQLLQVRE